MIEREASAGKGAGGGGEVWVGSALMRDRQSFQHSEERNMLRNHSPNVQN